VRCGAQFRAHGAAVPARAEVDTDTVTVRFDHPQEGVAPGQAVVLYDGDRVIGSATIEHTVRLDQKSPAGSPA
jgi:tRNA-uridine 2-sulfurtransferase